MPTPDARDAHETPCRAAVRDGLVVCLAAATGSLDAIAFLGLGGVFVSVITGNVVLFGIGIGRLEPTFVLRAGVATIAYGAGVALGVLVAGRVSDAQPLWPRRASAALLAEILLLVGFCTGWELAGAQRTTIQDVVLLAAAAAAMGIQSAAVVRLDVPGFSSTYLTSTYIGAITGLVAATRDHVVVKLLALSAAVIGAVIGAVILSHERPWVPVFPLGLLAIVTALGTFHSGRGRALGPREGSEAPGHPARQ